MSASKNPEAMTPAQGEFSSKVAPSEPLTTKGHALGTKVGNDAYPEFNAEQYPAGTAPKENTHLPQNPLETPVQALDPKGENRASASETITGATSADVHTGLGHPGSGQSSGGHRKREGAGLEGVGANPSDPMKDQGLDRDHTQGPGTDLKSATDQEPTSAGEIASERP